MTVTIYHNPRCSKSRQTLQILQEKNITTNVVEYLNEPPSRETLEQLLGYLQMEPRDLMRKNESIYKELNLSDDSLSRDALIDAMVQNPILIERPIVVVNGRAVLGRPPETVLTIIE